jgi:hypothetical protein
MINLKQQHPNIYMLIISICIVTWFYGITGIIMIITKNSKKLHTYLILCGLALFIMYIDDFKFSELYDYSSTDLVDTAAAVSAISASSV